MEEKTPINFKKLSVRLRNIFYRRDIETNEQVLKLYHDNELIKFRDFGVACLREVEKVFDIDSIYVEVTENSGKLQCPCCSKKIKIKNHINPDTWKRKRALGLI